MKFRHSVALISSSATYIVLLVPAHKWQPPFGSTDIIECNKGKDGLNTREEMPPFGSTDIIECNGMEVFTVQVVDGFRHSVALISSSATRHEGVPAAKTCTRHSVALISSSATWCITSLGRAALKPPFGSTDIIECNFVHAGNEFLLRVGRHSVALISSSATSTCRSFHLRLLRPPFGSTDIIECNREERR